jgi:hypothetical protein
MFSTLASTLFRDCHFGLVPQTLDSFGFSGGDDGARTRDLCRDRIPEGRNPLETGVVDGYLSALWNPGEPLLNPY